MVNQPAKYRNFIAGAASAALIASAVAPTVASAASFSDVADNNTHAPAIGALTEAGIITGYADGTFKPDKTLSRSDVVKMMGKWLVSLGYEVPTDYKTKPRFKDHTSKTNDELLKYSAIVKDNGVFKGYEDGTLGAGNEITRENMAIVLVRAYDSINKTDLVTTVKSKEFDKDVIDLAKAKAEARPYIDVLDYFDITNPKAPQFNPKNSTTRGQFASFLYKTSTLKVEDEVDTEAPKLVYNGDKTIEVEYDANFTLPVVTATDNKDEKVEVTSVITNAAGEKVNAIDTKVPGTYTVTYSAVDQANNKAENLILTIIVAEPAAPAVEKVAAVSATQVKVSFNYDVDPASLFEDNGTLKADRVAISAIDGQGALKITNAQLEDEGKSLLLTVDKAVSKRYKVVVQNAKTAKGESIEKYDEIVSFAADTTAPTITNTEQISATKVRINFSEPVKAHTAQLSYTDGQEVKGASVKVEQGATSVIVDLGNSKVEFNKTINVTFIGLEDMAGNLLSPNPTTVQIVKQQLDGIKPTVSSIAQTGVKTFNIQFTKDLDALKAANVEVSGGYTVDSVEKVSDREYKVTVNKNLRGVQNVVVSNYKDLSGQAGEKVTKVVTFTEDTVAPKAVSTAVTVDNGKEYLDITFDKNVVLDENSTVQATGTYVSKNITHSLNGKAVKAEYKNAQTKNIVRVTLSDLIGQNDDVKDAVYSVNLSFGSITSQSGVATTGMKNVSFIRTVDTTLPTDAKIAVDEIVQSAEDNNIVMITFDKNVDAASATNLANYNIDSAVIEKATVKADQLNVVELKLSEGTNHFSGPRNVVVENVKAAGSAVLMDKFTGKVNLKENVAPTVISAVITKNSEVTLTFSEAVTVDAGAFELFVGDSKTPIAGTTVAKVDPAAKTAVIQLAEGQTFTQDQFNEGIYVKMAKDKNVVDTVKNPLKFTEIKALN